MLLIFIFFLLVIILSSLTTIPVSVGLLVATTVLFKKSWVFFAAFLLGLFLDLFLLRTLGQTSLIFVIFIFVIWLYERKFETQTMTFVFVSTFLGSISYLWLFRQQMVFLQAFVNSLFAIILFRVMLNSFQHLTSKTRS